MPPRQLPIRTLDQLAARRQSKDALQQRWQQTIDAAAALHGLDYTAEGWPALTAWYATIPGGLPSRRDQDRWLAQQRVSASLTRTA